MKDSNSDRSIIAGSFVYDFLVEAGEREQFEDWRRGIEPLFALEANPPSSIDSFALAGRSFQFDGVSLGYTSSSGSRFERDYSRIERIGVDGLLLIAIEEGNGALTIDGRTLEIGKGDMFLLDLTRPSLHVMGPFVNTTVLMTRALIEPYCQAIHMLHGMLLPADSVANNILAAHLTQLRVSVANLTVEHAPAVANATAALIGLLASTANDGIGSDFVKTRDERLQRLRLFIRDNLANPRLGPKMICDALPFSRASLYRTMEPFDGVGRYIRNRRMEKAFHLLTRPIDQRVSIAAIAEACGFETASGFSRAVKESFGVSPRELAAHSQTRGNWAIDYGLKDIEDMRNWIIAGPASRR